MDKLNNLTLLNFSQLIQNVGASGWTGLNSPYDLEMESGIWVIKAGARSFPKSFSYNPEKDKHWEWGAILEGEFEFEFNGKHIRASKGSSYIMSPDITLTATPVNNPFLVWIEVAGNIAANAFQKIASAGEGLSLYKFSGEQVKNALKIARLLHEHPNGYQLNVQAHLWSFLSDLIYPGSLTEKKISLEIQNVLDYIENQKSLSKCSLEKLAKISSLPLETFRKKFNCEIGDSPIKYILKKQVMRAKELLSHKNLSIKHIALEVGFEDPYYFSRLFKKYEGVSPVEFRKLFYPESFR